MADVNANIHIGIDASQALGQLRALQSQISSFNRSVAAGNAAAAATQASMANSLASMVGATGQFNTSIRTMESGVASLGTAFDKGTLSARQYFRFAASQMPGLTRAFRSLGAEQAQMADLATDRVKRLQTQYVALGKDVRGMQKVMAIQPKNLASGMATDLAIAQQRQQLFNRALQLGSTGLVNWGKNTQWAGRQLMVGFTVPLTIAAGAAAKFFMELDKASMQFRRVYGDMNTSTQETEKNLEAMKALGVEYTKYGLAVKDVIDISARAAATGAQNEDLMAATEQTLRLATLGQMEYGRALDATISLQTAFAVSSEELGNKIDFLNAVENQTVLTMEDMALAVPRVAPVIKGLGGDVEDLAVFMTALREGGVSAEQGANALKSGLASLINPTARAQESLQALGININQIVQANRGDLMGTVRAFGEALNSLEEFERQQALEQVFGKYQYARLGALFKNIANDASQSARAMDLAGASAEELRQIAEKELNVISETVTSRFLGAIERLKVAIAPIGEMFLKVVTPVIDAVSAIANAFNQLPDGVKTAIGAVVAIVGGIAPVFLMGIGLIGNAIGNGLKTILALRNGVKGLAATLTGSSANFKYQSGAALDAAAAMASLEGRVSGLTGDLLMQEGAVSALTAAYRGLASAAAGAAAAMPRGFAMPGMVGGRPGGIIPPIRMATGGLVPGRGNRDTVPALLTPGESVVTKEATARYGPVIAAMNSGTLPGFNKGMIGEFAHIGGRATIKIQDLINMDEFSRAFTQSAQRKFRAMAQQLGPDFAVNLYRGLGFTSAGPINRGLASGGVKPADFLSDWDRRGIERWSTALKSAGLNVESVSGSLGTLDKGMRRYIQKYASVTGGPITDRVVERAYLSAIKKVGPDTPLAQSFGRLSNSITEARVNISKAAAEASGATVSRFTRKDGTPSSKMYTDIPGAGRVKIGGERLPLAASARNTGVLTVQKLLSQGGVLLIPGGVAGSATKAVKQGTGVSAPTQQPITSKFTRGQNWAVSMGRSIMGSSSARMNIGARSAIGAASPATQGTRLVTDYVAGMQVGASQSSGRVTTMGTNLGNAFGNAARVASLDDMATMIQQRKAMFGNEFGPPRGPTSPYPGMGGGGPEEPRRRGFMSRMRFGRGGIGGMGMGASMGLGMASMIPFMMQDEQGQFMGMNANVAGMGLMGASALAGMIGLVSGPILAVVAGLAAAGVALYALRNAADEAARASAEMGANLGVSANALRNMGEMMGKPTPSQQLAQVRLGLTPEQAQEAFGEFQNMFNTEQGQAFLEQIESATSADRFKMLGDYVAAAIASGMMDVTTGQAFAKTIAAYLNDPVLGNAVAQSVAKQEKGTQALIDLAEKRMNAVSESLAVKEVKRFKDYAATLRLLEMAPESGARQLAAERRRRRVTGDRAQGFYTPPSAAAGQDWSLAASEERRAERQALVPRNPAMAVGAAIQVIQDFADAAAMAELEYKQGTISFSEYNDAVNIAQQAQQEYASVIAGAVQSSVLNDTGALMQGIKMQLEKIGIDEEQFGQIETAAKNMAAVLNNGAAEVENNGIVLGDAIAAVASGMNAADIVSILEFTKDATTQAAQFYQQNMGQTGALQKTGLIGTIESGMMPGVVSEEDQQVVIEFIADFEGSEADLQAFLASIPAERVMDVIINLKTMTLGQQASYVTSAGQIAGIVNAQTQSAIESYVSQRATGTTTPMAPSAVGGTPARARPQNIADIRDSAKTTAALAEQQKIAEELQKARDAGVFEDINTVIDVLLKEEPPDIAERLPEITDGALALKESVPDEILKIIGIDLSNAEDVDFYAPYAAQLKGLYDVLQQIPDGMVKNMAVNLMLDENGKPKNIMQFGKDVVKLEKNLKKFDSIEVKDTVKRKNILFEIMSMTVGPDGTYYDSAESQAVIDQIVAATGLTEAEFLALPTDVVTKTIATAISVDNTQLRAAAAALRAAGNALMMDAATRDLGQEKLRQAAALEAAANASIQAAVSLPAASTGGSTGGSSGGGGGGGGAEDPLEAMMKDLKTQKKLVGDYVKEQEGVSSGFATALRRAGTPEYLIAEIIAKGEDGIKIAKKLLADKKKKLQELMKLSLEVARFTLIEAQRAAVGNFKAQSSAQNILFGAGVDPTVAMDIASDPAQAAMIVAERQKVADAEAKLAEARKKGKGVEKAQKELRAAQKDWRELTGSIKMATLAQKEFEKESAPIQVAEMARQQREILGRQQAALTRLMSQDFTFEQAQEFAGDETISLALVSTGRAADAAARRVAYLDKKLKELKEAKGKNKNEKEIKRVQAALREARKEADKTSKAYESLIDELKSLTEAQRRNLIANTTREYEGLTAQLGKQLTVLGALTAAGISYEQASAIANDPTRATAFYDALQKGGKVWENLIAEVKAYDRALADVSVASKIFEFQEQAQKNLRIPEVNAIAKQFGGQYSGMVAETLMGMTPAELEAFFRMTDEQQKEWIDNLLASVPVAEKIKYLFDQINAAQKYQSLLNRDATNAKIGDREALEDQLKAQRKLLKAEQDKLKAIQKTVDAVQEENDDYNRGLDLLSRQEEKINEAFDKRLESLDKVEQANARIAQQQQNQLNLAQALSTGDIYAATQAAQQIKQDNATAAIENTREALEQAREEQLKDLVVEVNGALLTREQIEKRIEANNDRIYQIQEDQIEPIEAVIDGIQDQIDRIETLRDAWQDYYDDLEKNAVDPLTGMKYSELEKIKAYYDALIGRGMEAGAAFNQAMSDYIAGGGKITDEARLRGYFGVAATPAPPTAADGEETGAAATTTGEGATADINDAKEAAILALPEVQKVLDVAKNIKKAIAETPSKIVEFTKSLVDNAQPAIDTTKEKANGILNKFKSLGKFVLDDLIPNSLTPLKDFIAINLIDEIDKVIRKFVRINTEITNAISNVTNLANSLSNMQKDIVINITVNTIYTSSGSPTPNTPNKPKKFMGGLIRMATGGMIPGGIPRDSVPILASPGEFVVRNAMVDKYGMSMLNDINQGSFQPSFKTPSGTTYTKINKPTELNTNRTMYNNNYNINVTANTNANADEIASATVMKIRQMNSMQIRSARG